PPPPPPRWRPPTFSRPYSLRAPRSGFFFGGWFLVGFFCWCVWVVYLGFGCCLCGGLGGRVCGLGGGVLVLWGCGGFCVLVVWCFLVFFGFVCGWVWCLGCLGVWCLCCVVGLGWGCCCLVVCCGGWGVVGVFGGLVVGWGCGWCGRWC
ncbi:hypothetical protein RA272_27775, partial [Pseudomonas syringae pv. tagetis]|uniref:hypothetical protein n=1 Tax=Pseudomonas syringae group genomosp. 7 TaxID=251699 RepID=UPI00376F7083